MKGNNAIKALLEQKRLLTLEYQEEKALFTKLAEETGLESLRAKGNAWVDIKIGNSFYNSLNQRVVEVYRSGEESEYDHNFEYGRPVEFFLIPSGYRQEIQYIFKGTVSYVEGERMVVSIPEEADLNTLATIRAGVILSFDETTYRLMFEALEYAMKATGRLAQLRDSIYSKKGFEWWNLSPMTFSYLNKVQEKAVNRVLAAKDVMVVHGPPGTGKTTTLVEAIYETLRREPQVLVCAQSNMAVDWIAEKLVDRGLNVLRLGNPTKVNDKMISFTYERRFESHPLYSDLWGLRKVIRQLYKEKSHTESWHQKIERLKSRATEMEIRINQDLLNQAHVVASTLAGSGSRLLQGMKFSTLFIDEAAQALEAATWIPMRRVGRLILAGDHCQLPPTVKSFEAMKGGLGKSLMEKIVEYHPDAVELLTTQYRMHNDLMQYSNRWFYGGAMNSHPNVKNRSILDLDTTIEWIDTGSGVYEKMKGADTDSFKEEVTKNYGKINKNEAILALTTLQTYIEKISINRILEENLDIGIISPYRAQVVFLRKLLKKTPFIRPIRRLISVNTVDGFQGQERDIILISMVRSNDEGKIGFLNDLRRMNVAMTRARMKLIIIGDTTTLSSHRFYGGLIKYIKSLKEDRENNSIFNLSSSHDFLTSSTKCSNYGKLSSD